MVVSSTAVAKENNPVVLFVEGGKAKSARVVSEGDRRLKVVLADGLSRRIERSKSACRLSRMPNSRETDLAVEAAAKITMITVWKMAAGEILEAEILARRSFTEQDEIVRMLALTIAHGKVGGFFIINDCSWQPISATSCEKLLAGQAKREQQRLQIKKWEQELANGILPIELREYLDEHVQGKNEPNDRRHRFLQQYGRLRGKSLGKLSHEFGVIKNLTDYHLLEFKNRLSQPQVDIEVKLPDIREILAQNGCSIDASGTIEIDDAFSVSADAFGIHIAAPALGLPKPAWTQAFERKSTIYLPDEKYMMLPLKSVGAYSLESGGVRSCVSLLFETDSATGKLGANRFAIGGVRIKSNLDIEDFTASSLLRKDLDTDSNEFLVRLHDIASQLDNNFRPVTGHLVKVVDGKPVVRLRSDFALADRCVAALMVCYNKLAARLLHEAGIPFLHRHAGCISIHSADEPYGWFTSPLRRIIDLLNQEQLLAAITNRRPPHSASRLASLAREFNSSYSWTQQFQQRMEKFWALRWLQNNTNNIYAGVVNASGNKVLIDAAPVEVRLAETVAGASNVQVRINSIDEFSLIAYGSLVG